MKYQVIGRKQDGSTVYYTGRAGQAFVSENSLQAFQFDTLEYARHRAKVLNRMTELHRIRFIAPCPDPQFADISNVQEYGLTQKLSNSIRCF